MNFIRINTFSCPINLVSSQLRRNCRYSLEGYLRIRADFLGDNVTRQKVVIASSSAVSARRASLASRRLAFQRDKAKVDRRLHDSELQRTTGNGKVAAGRALAQPPPPQQQPRRSADTPPEERSNVAAAAAEATAAGRAAALAAAAAAAEERDERLQARPRAFLVLPHACLPSGGRHGVSGQPV